jgi:agmatine deiminase
LTTNDTTPVLTVPAEWAPQKAIWTAWPANENEWNGDLAAPRADIAGLVTALHAAGNTVRVLVNGAEAESSARVALGDAAELVSAKYGDIWLRDTGPIFARDAEVGAVALRFATNSWGGKYDLPDDATVGDDVARGAEHPPLRLRAGRWRHRPRWRGHDPHHPADAAQS